MSGLQKTTKININFQSSGAFLNINKPKFLSLGKSYNIKNINVKNNNHNISQDTFHNDNISRQTESSSKDEMIRALKERLTVLEKKVKILETENNENTSKINFLNLSHGHNKRINKEMKLNIKIFKNKKKFNNILNLSETHKKENTNKNQKIQKTFNNDDIHKNKKLNKNLNFFESINISGMHTNINKLKNKIRISKSASKYSNFTIIPKNISKRKIFIDILKKKKVRFATVENEKVGDKEKNNNYNKNIPKIPQKEKFINKSEKVKKHESKINEIKKENFNEPKRRFLLFNRFSRMKSCNLDNLRHIDLKKNFDNSNDNLANDFKNKLDHIKNRTKKLLEFYADKKISTINFNVNSNNN